MYCDYCHRPTFGYNIRCKESEGVMSIITISMGTFEKQKRKMGGWIDSTRQIQEYIFPIGGKL